MPVKTWADWLPDSRLRWRSIKRFPDYTKSRTPSWPARCGERMPIIGLRTCCPSLAAIKMVRRHGPHCGESDGLASHPAGTTSISQCILRGYLTNIDPSAGVSDRPRFSSRVPCTAMCDGMTSSARRTQASHCGSHAGFPPCMVGSDYKIAQ